MVANLKKARQTAARYAEDISVAKWNDKRAVLRYPSS